MQESARDGMQERFKVVYGTAGRPCPRCGELSNIRSRGQGDDNRTTYWCPRCQRLRRIGHKGADLIVPGNTPASFDAALAHGVDMIEFDVLPEHQHEPAKGRLLLAHDYDHVDGAPTLEEGLAHLASLPFDGVDLDVDLKLPGYEAARRRRAARARPDRAHADLLELDALADDVLRSSSPACASAGRSRACARTRRRCG